MHTGFLQALLTDRNTEENGALAGQHFEGDIKWLKT